jgi:uncharacterized protein (DUF697 family)/putative sterol carrier protein
MSWLDTLEQIRTRDFQSASTADREKAARDVVNMCSYACAVVSVSPLPFSDALLMLPIQSGMVMTIGHIFGRRLDQAEAKDLILELGAVAGVGFLARQGIKALLPVVGALLTVPAAFAANWAMGRVAMEYFKDPSLSRDQIRDLFNRAKEEGSSRFSKSAFDEFRRKNEDEIKDVVKEKVKEKEEEKPEPPPAPAARKPASKTIGRGTRAKTKSATAAKAAPKKSIGKKKDGPRTARSIVEQEIPRKVLKQKDAAAKINAIIHLDIQGPEGGQWTLDLSRPEDCVSRGLKGQPKMTVRCDDAFFVKLASGNADPQVAVFTGKLKLEPLDVETATQIGQIFTA